ncbi:MAG: hypothetical protein PW734_08870 [Verrucomicrobium sp.]|nr:hypothetical protein [Verrucomicrobium sp.]
MSPNASLKDKSPRGLSGRLIDWGAARLDEVIAAARAEMREGPARRQEAKETDLRRGLEGHLGNVVRAREGVLRESHHPALFVQANIGSLRRAATLVERAPEPQRAALIDFLEEAFSRSDAPVRATAAGAVLALVEDRRQGR